MRKVLMGVMAAGAVLAAGSAGAGVTVANVNSTRGLLNQHTLVAGDNLTNNGPFSTNGRPQNVVWLFNEGADADGEPSFLLHFDRSGGLLATGRVSGSFEFQLTGDTVLDEVLTGSGDLRDTDNLANGVQYQRCLACLNLGATIFRGLEPSPTPIFGDIISVVQHPSQALIYTVTYDLSNDGTTMDEVRFTFGTATAAVPEPASWALMIGGFGLAGAALRRRRAQATVA